MKIKHFDKSVWIIVFILFYCNQKNDRLEGKPSVKESEICFDMNKLSKRLITNSKELRVVYDATSLYSKFIGKFPQIIPQNREGLLNGEPRTHTFLINKEYKIYHTINRFEYEDKSLSSPEHINILGVKYDLNDIFSNTISKIFVEPRIKFTKIYEILYQRKKMMLLQAEHRYSGMYFDAQYKILFDISDSSNIQVYTSIDGYKTDANCFSDFDDDGNIDYLYYSPVYNTLKNIERLEKNPYDTLKMYTLVKNEFYLTKYYVTIFHKKHQTSGCYTFIDKSKTNCFF